jgi:NAD(P)-dependent dehydrogenase (short-subunit alcohol dehydrogenase family)
VKRDESFAWNRVDASALDLKGINAAIIGGTGGIGRAFSRFMASRGARVLVVGQTFRDSARSNRGGRSHRKSRRENCEDSRGDIH